MYIVANALKKMNYELQYIEQAHRSSLGNKDELLKSELCACFYCCSTYKLEKITDWVEENDGETALCPLCNNDAVLSDKFPIRDKDFLLQMNQYWFK